MIGAFILLLLTASTASVFAQGSPPEGALPSSTAFSSNAEELSRLPGDSEMAETLAGFAADENARQRETETPAAIKEREESADLYTDLTPAEAGQLLSSEFSAQLDALDSDPARFLSDVTLLRPLGDGGALIADEGKKKLIEGTAPIVLPDDGGKIDLSLEAAGGAFEPENPIVDLRIPASSSDGVEIGDNGLGVSQAGSSNDVDGHVTADDNVFYPEVEADTDLLVAPIASGVELFDQLRSEDSPETLRFRLDVPPGAHLSSQSGAAVVTDSDGKTLAYVPPPSAVDAQGTDIPVQMSTEGETLILQVEHDPGSVAGPMPGVASYVESFGRGDINHLQFVVGTQIPPGKPREALIANESEPEDANYSAMPWRLVKKRIEKGNPSGWDRIPLLVTHRTAIWDEPGAKKHDPANLYNSNGIFQG